MANAESLCERAHVWVRQGRYREAEAAYREAVRNDPGRLRAAAVEHAPERLLPARAQGGDVQGGPQPLPVVPGQVEQRVDLGDGHGMRTTRRPHDLIAGADETFGQHA